MPEEAKSESPVSTAQPSATIKKPINWKRIIVAIFVSLFVIGAITTVLFSILVYKFLTTPWFDSDADNPPNAEIKELSWPEGPYKIFYLGDGLFSQNTDGSEKKLLYKFEQYGDPKQDEVEEYLLLNSTREIVLIGTKQITLLQEDGKNPQTIYELAENQYVGSMRLLPDEQKLVVKLYYDNSQDDKEEIYLVDLVEKTATESTNTQGFGLEETLIWEEEFYESISPDRSKTAKIKFGKVLVDGEEIMHWYNYDVKWNRGYRNPIWLPDNEHIIITKPSSIRIIEIITKKVADFTDGHNVKYFGQTSNLK